jgi:hypothetical protein
MKNLLFTLFVVLIASSLSAQPVTEETICREVTLDEEGVPVAPCLEVDSDDVIILKLEINRLVQQRTQLLHTQQEWNNANANVHINGLDNLIANYTNKRDNAANAEATAFWQTKLDNVLAEKVLWEDTSEGSPRDEASKLGPQISALMLEFTALKQELRAIE